ncbi:Tachykinin-like peptides receptor 86C [Polyplax serrata]|uniref:Tachykinin-like peptides receptor 86C n=1 Tax=Polyplax serrata TaxID=468196 RepID=A0AAN8S9E2_POLSC
MRTVTNYFLVNLSVSDLLMSVLNCICNFIFMLNANWPFGTFYCSLNNFVSSVTVAAGVFTLMAISFGEKDQLEKQTVIILKIREPDCSWSRNFFKREHQDRTKDLA